MRSWDDLKPEFDRAVFKLGVDSVAREIPAHRVTVYRLVSGETAQPSLPMRAGIERMLENQRDPQHFINRGTNN